MTLAFFNQSITELVIKLVPAMTKTAKDVAIVIEFGERCAKDNECWEGMRILLNALFVGAAKARDLKELELLLAELENKVRFYGGYHEAKAEEGKAD